MKRLEDEKKKQNDELSKVSKAVRDRRDQELMRDLLTFDKRVSLLRDKLLRAKAKLESKNRADDADSINSEWMSFDEDEDKA